MLEGLEMRLAADAVGSALAEWLKREGLTSPEQHRFNKSGRASQACHYPGTQSATL